jgi:Flp pilus assembly protein TadB
MSKELVAVMVGAAFTLAVATIPDVRSWGLSIFFFFVTIVLFFWWVHKFRDDHRFERDFQEEICRRLDVLTADERAALQGLVWRGLSTSVEREILERVKEKTQLIERSFSGDFIALPEYSSHLRKIFHKRKKHHDRSANA